MAEAFEERDDLKMNGGRRGGATGSRVPVAWSGDEAIWNLQASYGRGKLQGKSRQPAAVTKEAWQRAWMRARSCGDPGGNRLNKRHVPEAAFALVEDGFEEGQ